MRFGIIDHNDDTGRPHARQVAGRLELIEAYDRLGFYACHLPDEFPSPSTCWRRLKQWEDEGVWLNAWRTLLGALDEEGLLKWDETFLDGSFAPAKKGALPSVKPSAARARSGWYWSTVKVFRWEFGWKVPLRRKLRLRKPRSPKSAFRDPKAVRGKSRNG